MHFATSAVAKDIIITENMNDHLKMELDNNMYNNSFRQNLHKESRFFRQPDHSEVIQYK